MLLLAGADRNLTDGNGHRPIDVIVAPSKFPDLKDTLERLLRNDDSVHLPDIKVSIGGEKSNSSSHLSSPENGPLSSAVDSASSLNNFRLSDTRASSPPERKEYPVDPSLPDIKNSAYSTDEFRMFSFKIWPCSRAYSHDWTECPFVHPGENARRRDPRKFRYSCVPCPDFRKGQCRRGDLCEYAHGVFECWLHPAQYRTRLCKDGTGCSRRMVLENRTPLMADVNLSCGPDKSTALHCAASSGSVNAVDVVQMLLLAGADRNLTDGNGHRPIDVIVAPSKFPDLKDTLERLLRNDDSVHLPDIKVSFGGEKSNSSSHLSSPENGPLSSAVDSASSLNNFRLSDTRASSPPERKEYPVDPSLPDIKNSAYSTDEFRMFSFKIWPCSRAYSHDWTECPFVHPGENARRRDPRKFRYSCVPCPDFRKGQCRRGDLCEYAHGVFECWLHPAQYRTRLCKDGTGCSRRVCFSAHTSEELRKTDDVNLSCGPDKSTALHCAASSGSVNAVDVVQMLLLAGADRNLTDGNGHRPIDVIVAPSKFPDLKDTLERLLRNDDSVHLPDIKVSFGGEKSNSSSHLSSPENGPLSSAVDSASSLNNFRLSDTRASSPPERKEYPVDPSLPDIKNSAYSTDEFRMFSFKIWPCSRAYSHDWTECPFVHPGENARRRDPRKFRYSCVPCPDFRKGQCRRGDL
ncbi:unnamed protein product [Camellia sinensis]